MRHIVIPHSRRDEPDAVKFLRYLNETRGERTDNEPLIGRKIGVFVGGELLALIGMDPVSLSAIILTPPKGRNSNPLNALHGPAYANFEDAMADIIDLAPSAYFA